MGDQSLLYRIGWADTVALHRWMILFRGSKLEKSSGCHSEMNWDVLKTSVIQNHFPSLQRLGPIRFGS